MKPDRLIGMSISAIDLDVSVHDTTLDYKQTTDRLRLDLPVNHGL